MVVVVLLYLVISLADLTQSCWDVDVMVQRRPSCWWKPCRSANGFMKLS